MILRECLKKILPFLGSLDCLLCNVPYMYVAAAIYLLAIANSVISSQIKKT